MPPDCRGGACPSPQTVDNPSPMRQGTDTHGGIVKGGWESPLHVQSTQEWELFSEVPILAFKLSTLCRQLEGRGLSLPFQVPATPSRHCEPVSQHWRGNPFPFTKPTGVSDKRATAGRPYESALPCPLLFLLPGACCGRPAVLCENIDYFFTKGLTAPYLGDIILISNQRRREK